MRKLINILGHRYGRLTVVSEALPYIYANGAKQRMVLCKCDCGNEVIVRINDIRKGVTKSCGCFYLLFLLFSHSIVSNSL